MLNLYKILHLEKYIGYIYKTIYIVKNARENASILCYKMLEKPLVKDSMKKEYKCSLT